MHASLDSTLRLLAGSSHPTLAERIASDLATPLTPLQRRTFASDETYVRIEDSVRGTDVLVVQTHTPPVDKHIMELLLTLDAAKRASARSLSVVLPFFPYARQDKKSLPREPISARLVVDLLSAAGVGRIVTMDVHTDQLQGFFDGPVDTVSALPVLVGAVQRHEDLSSLVVVSPDAGRVRLAERWSDKLSSSLAIVHKRRDPHVPNKASVHDVVGEVEGRTCLIVDDMVDTAGTLVEAARALKERGATRVIAAATHGVLSGPALERIEGADLDHLYVTDTLPTPSSSSLTTVSAAHLLSEAIRQVFVSGSVSDLDH